MEQQITRTVTCKLPGFETVQITYNLAATLQQVDNLVRQSGTNGSHEGVIVTIEGWPAAEYGPNPWDAKRVPAIWFAWAGKKGWGLALQEYLNDPNS